MLTTIFCRFGITASIGYDAVQVTLDDLTTDQLVRLLVVSKHSRRAVKRHLHDLGLPASADDVDKALAVVRQRDDFASLQHRADAFGYSVESAAEVAFDPLGDLRRQLRILTEDPNAFATRAASETGLNVSTIRDTIAGRIDAPMSVIFKILSAAGAKRVSFDPRR